MKSFQNVHVKTLYTWRLTRISGEPLQFIMFAYYLQCYIILSVILARETPSTAASILYPLLYLLYTNYIRKGYVTYSYYDSDFLLLSKYSLLPIFCNTFDCLYLTEWGMEDVGDAAQYSALEIHETNKLWHLYRH